MAAETPVTRKPGIEFYGGYQVYSESGVDLTMLRENLKRTVEERFRGNRQALEFFEALRGGSCISETPALLQQLANHQVEYVVVGNAAMALHGSTMLTQVFGICYRRAEKNLLALVAAFEPFHPRLRGAPTDLPCQFNTAVIRSGVNVILNADCGSVDLLGAVPGIGDYEQVLARAETRDVRGLVVHVLSLDGLIDSKKATGTEHDRVNVQELEALKKLKEEARRSK